MGGSALGSGGEGPRLWRTSEAGHHRATDGADGRRLGHLAGLLVACHGVDLEVGNKGNEKGRQCATVHNSGAQVSTGHSRSLRPAHLCVLRLEQGEWRCTPGDAVESPWACCRSWALSGGHKHLLAASASTLTAKAFCQATLWLTTTQHDALASLAATRSIRDCWNSLLPKLFPSSAPDRRLL